MVVYKKYHKPGCNETLKIRPAKISKASYARNPCAYLNFLFFITEIQG